MVPALDSPLLLAEGLARLGICIERAARDWNYLSAIAGEGPIQDLERALGRHLGARWVVAMNSGSMALHVALLAAGVGPGDEVILPAITWPQVLFSVQHCSATPILADVSPCSVTIDPASVAQSVSSKTRVILATHLYGFPADIEQLNVIARCAGALLVADAAQGMGALIQGKPIGSAGDYVALSFGRGKLLTAGEGGALICRRRELYERAIRISQHPLRMHREIDDPTLRSGINPLGLNGRLHPLVASLALGQLQGLLRQSLVPKIRTRFQRLVQDLQDAGLAKLLPALPLWGTPSGICLPLVGDIGESERLLQQIGRRLGYLLCEETPPTLLEVMETNSSPIFLRGACAPKRKLQNGMAPCPNSEGLHRNLRWRMRLDLAALLEERHASG